MLRVFPLPNYCEEYRFSCFDIAFCCVLSEWETPQEQSKRNKGSIGGKCDFVDKWGFGSGSEISHCGKLVLSQTVDPSCLCLFLALPEGVRDGTWDACIQGMYSSTKLLILPAPNFSTLI